MLVASAAGLLCACGFAATEQAITLARDGKPLATIVIPAPAQARETTAAAELQTYVRQICGVELPIHRDGKRVSGTGLYIGRCEPTTEADLPGVDANPESYALRVRDGNLFFIGRQPTPTYFAVASFIEDVLGVRWFAPGDLWQHVPQGPAGKLEVRVRDAVTTPGTSPRVWSGHGWYPSWNAWSLRNKAVLSEVVPRRQFQNFLYRVFPPEKYGQTHPEYYPLINGKRYIPAGDHYWRPCESHPDVLRLTVEYARKWFDEHPDIDSFSLGMDDISHMCSCAKCRALDPRPDSYERHEFSDRHYKFVNAVARELQHTHPDRYVGTLIYNIARQLPQTVPTLEPNVFGFITEESAAWWQPGVQQADHELTREWARRCKHLSRYDYYGLGTLTPRVYPHAMAEQIRFDKSLGLEGMYIETYTFPPHTAPMIWVLAKLQCDPTLDVERLLHEFYAKMYGPAAPIMGRYFGLLERSWNTARPGRGAWCHRNLTAQAQALSAADVDTGFALLKEAASAAGTPSQRQRIEIHRAALEYSSFVIYAYDISQQLTTLAVADAAAADRAGQLIARLDALSAQRDACWQAARTRDDLLGETVRGLGDKMHYLATGQVSRLEQGGPTAAMRLLAWCGKHDPQRLATLEAVLAKDHSGMIAQTVRAWRLVHEKQPKNLLANGDFQTSGSTDAPAGWSTWSRTAGPRFAIQQDVDAEHGRVARVAGAESACYTQAISVQAGEQYLCLADVKAEPSERFGEARLSVRFRSAKGGWHPRRDAEPVVALVGGQSGWQTLTLLVRVPDGAAGLVVMPGVSDQPAGASASFDNVRLYRIP